MIDINALIDGFEGLGVDEGRFCGRVWSVDPDIYADRLNAIGFEGLDRVLDAGCGFGQWTLPLAEANFTVDAIDLNPARTRALEVIAKASGTDNVAIKTGSISPMPALVESFHIAFYISQIFIRVSLSSLV